MAKIESGARATLCHHDLIRIESRDRFIHLRE